KRWLRSIGALAPDAPRSFPFSTELDVFREYMRLERGLSSATITNRMKSLCWFFSTLPPDIRSLERGTIADIDSFLEFESRRGWTRASIRTLAGDLRSFFRYAAQRGWCSSNLEHGIDPRSR